MRELKRFSVALLASLSLSVLATPPVPKPVGATCDPPCDVFTCGQHVCIVCNDEGSVGFPAHER
jgi:hypothetical protein